MTTNFDNQQRGHARATDPAATGSLGAASAYARRSVTVGLAGSGRRFRAESDGPKRHAQAAGSGTNRAAEGQVPGADGARTGRTRGDKQAAPAGRARRWSGRASAAGQPVAKVRFSAAVSAQKAEQAQAKRRKMPVGSTNFMKYAADNRVVRGAYWLVKGPYRAVFYLLVVVAVLASLYGPARDYYVAFRTHDILTKQLAIREKYNKSLEKDVDALLTQEGIEDAAREDLGLVREGEQTITVTGGDTGSSSSTSGDSEPSTSAEVERAEQAVMEDSSWYFEWLDQFFGFDGSGGMAVVSTGDK